MRDGWVASTTLGFWITVDCVHSSNVVIFLACCLVIVVINSPIDHDTDLLSLFNLNPIYCRNSFIKSLMLGHYVYNKNPLYALQISGQDFE